MIEAEGSGLFLVFFLSLYTIVLVPYTIYKLCNLTEDKHVVKPWAKGSKKPAWLSGVVQQLTKPGNLVLLGLWAIFAFLVFYVQVSTKDTAPFDPYNILELEKGASDKDVKRAYRQLSLRFHPDKNPDPEASKYFAEYITKAYKALSDPVARKNYEEHGHPDGPQSISMGIALPKWLLEGDAKMQPILLAGLVLVFILLPLIAAACYLLSADKYVGKDGLIAETYEMFLRSPYGIKEGQSLSRIMETLTVAVEFINLPTLSNQLPALEELRKDTLRMHPDLRDKKQFWQRKPGCVKAGMLLLAHLERSPTPAALDKDRRFVLNRSAALLAEMANLAALPRPPAGYGWLAPAVGSIEFLQHLVQAVPLSARRNAGSHKSTVEGAAPLLQLPHMDAEVARKLLRKRVRGLPELQALQPAERREILQWAGLSDDQVEEVETSLSLMPSVSVMASCEVDGEPEARIQVEDIVTCKARILLTRPSHAFQELGKDGRAVAAFAPHFPEPREEKWFLFVADPLTNEVVSPVAHVSLLEAEYAGAKAAQAAEQEAADDSSKGAAQQQSSSKVAGASKELATSKEDEEKGQLVEVKFMPRTAARKEYTLFVMCDSWIGADRVVPLKLKVSEKSRAEREGRAPRSGRVIPLDEFGNPEEEVDDFYEEDEEAEEGEEDEEEYDSEDSGTEESGSDEEDAAPDAAKGKAAAVQDADSDDSDQSTAEHEEGIVPKSATLQKDD